MVLVALRGGPKNGSKCQLCVPARFLSLTPKLLADMLDVVLAACSVTRYVGSFCETVWRRSMAAHVTTQFCGKVSGDRD